MIGCRNRTVRRSPRAAVIDITDGLSNRSGAAEIERSSRDREDLARWQELVIDWSVKV